MTNLHYDTHLTDLVFKKYNAKIIKVIDFHQWYENIKNKKHIFILDMRLSIALKFTGLLVLQCSRASFQPPQS